MDFPIIDLIDNEQATDWLLKHFHPEGLHCPHCGASVKEARHFSTTRVSQLQIYRCVSCEGVYNLYSGTAFQQKQFTPSQTVLLLRGVCQGVSSAQLGRELGVSRQTVMSMRRVLESHAEAMRPDTALPDAVVETDEMFQNAGEKGDPHRDPSDPPRRRGNKRKGHGTYANDRPRSLALLDAPVSKCDCGSCFTPIKRPSRIMFTGSPALMRPCIQMLGGGMLPWIASMPRCATAMASGREMMIPMGFAKFIPIPLKVSGRRFATSFVPFGAFIKSASLAILLFVSSL